MAPALLVGAEAQQRRPEHVEADDVDELGRAGGGELLVDDDLLGGRPAAAAELARPGAARRSPAAWQRACQPRSASIRSSSARGSSRGVGPLGGEEAADLLLERALGSRSSELS